MALIEHLVRRNMSYSPRFYYRKIVEGGVGDEIGRLVNEDGSVVIFRVDSLIVQSRNGEFSVAWSDIVGYKNPFDKYEVQGVFVCTKETDFFVPMPGSYGLANRFKDAYCFINVLNVICRINNQRDNFVE